MNNNLKIYESILLFFIFFCCAINNHAQSNNLQQSDSVINDKNLNTSISDILDAKDLKAISSFGDTLILNRFLDEIKNFEKDDSINLDRKIDIVFTGSSSIRKWTNLQNDMKELKVVNRGFGGSTIPEVIYYSDILVFKHKPTKIVFYAGENDISQTKTNPTKVLNSFIYFQKLVNQKLPNACLYFVAIKLSPSRSKYWNSIKTTNKMIEQYCTSTKNCVFINPNKFMLDSNKQIRKDIYLKDQLHLNAEGYQIWTKVIYNAIKKQNK